MRWTIAGVTASSWPGLGLSVWPRVKSRQTRQATAHARVSFCIAVRTSVFSFVVTGLVHGGVCCRLSMDLKSAKREDGSGQ